MRRANVLIAALAAASCDSVAPDAGLDARMRATGAEFVRGSMPDDTAGPKVASVVLVSTAVHAGVVGKSLTGAIDPNGTAAALQLAGDPGYWVLPAGVADVSSPGFPSYKTELSFASTLGTGRYDLVVRAVDASGHFGAATVTPLDAIGVGRPDGALVVSLTWTNGADLDLHLVDPTGVEVFNRNPSSYLKPPPGSPPPPPDFVPTGGLLDVDSNGGCIQDGRRAENVVYAQKPPSGHYLVRVDAASMCGEASAYWRVEAFLAGQSIGTGGGIATDADTRFTHDRGAGILALQFDVP